MAHVSEAPREGLTVVPLCPFARAWLRRHREIADLAAVDWGPDQAT
jgi:predicted GNAT family acetyltransferase